MIRFLLILIASLSIVACASKPTEGEGKVVGPDITEPTSQDIKLGSDGGAIDGLYSINFPYDQYRLSEEAKGKLQQNIQWMNSNQNKALQIEGHCDSRGSIEYNFTLGERRAMAVKTHMVKNGVDGSRLSILSLGEEKPLNMEDNEAAHATNRRANFVPTE